MVSEKVTSDVTRKDMREKWDREKIHKTGERGEWQLDAPTRRKEKAEAEDNTSATMVCESVIRLSFSRINLSSITCKQKCAYVLTHARMDNMQHRPKHARACVSGSGWTHGFVSIGYRLDEKRLACRRHQTLRFFLDFVKWIDTQWFTLYGKADIRMVSYILLPDRHIPLFPTNMPSPQPDAAKCIGCNKPARFHAPHAADIHQYGPACDVHRTHSNCWRHRCRGSDLAWPCIIFPFPQSSTFQSSQIQIIANFIPRIHYLVWWWVSVGSFFALG